MSKSIIFDFDSLNKNLEELTGKPQAPGSGGGKDRPMKISKVTGGLVYICQTCDGSHLIDLPAVPGRPGTKDYCPECTEVHPTFGRRVKADYK